MLTYVDAHSSDRPQSKELCIKITPNLSCGLGDLLRLRYCDRIELKVRDDMVIVIVHN